MLLWSTITLPFFYVFTRIKNAQRLLKIVNSLWKHYFDWIYEIAFIFHLMRMQINSNTVYFPLPSEFIYDWTSSLLCIKKWVWDIEREKEIEKTNEENKQLTHFSRCLRVKILWSWSFSVLHLFMYTTYSSPTRLILKKVLLTFTFTYGERDAWQIIYVYTTHI